MAATEEQLWEDYRCGAQSAQAQLLEKYLPLARRLAASLYANRAVDAIEFSDYLHLAYVGLLEAMQRYHREEAAQFATFATYRIRGSVLNGIPRMTEVGSLIAHMKQVRRDRTRSLLGDTDSPPSNFAGLMDLVAGIALTYQLDELLESDEPNLQCANDPYGSRVYDEMLAGIGRILGQLPAREHQIIYYHYFYQIDFDEIAILLNVSKSRVSRLHKRAIALVLDEIKKANLSELY